MANQYDIEIEQGVAFDMELGLEDVNGEPLDLLGYSAEMRGRVSLDDDVPIFVFSSEAVATWSNLVAYVEGNIVEYSGNYYYAIAGSTNKLPDEENSLYWKRIGFGTIVISEIAGLLTFNMPSQETRVIDFSQGKYELEIYDLTDTVRFMEGTVRLRREAAY